MYDKKVFCNGLLCHKNNRQKCNTCGAYCCKELCSAIFEGKRYCVDCFVELWFKKLEKKIYVQHKI